MIYQGKKGRGDPLTSEKEKWYIGKSAFQGKGKDGCPTLEG